MPDSVRAGRHTWTFHNDGASLHEFIIARLRPGAELKRVVDSLHARGLRAFLETQSSAIAVGTLFALPGATAAAEIVTHDKPGDVLIAFCQLRDAPDKQKHDALGMFKIVRVQ